MFEYSYVFKMELYAFCNSSYICMYSTDFLETWHELSCFSSNQQIEFAKQNTVTKKNLTNHNGGFHPKCLFQEHGRGGFFEYKFLL